MTKRLAHIFQRSPLPLVSPAPPLHRSPGTRLAQDFSFLIILGAPRVSLTLRLRRTFLYPALPSPPPPTSEGCSSHR